jgi:cytochrome P450
MLLLTKVTILSVSEDGGTDVGTIVIGDRRKSGERRGDLLDLMLAGKDPQTGLSLDEENIRYQLLTFLIAGHETTS